MTSICVDRPRFILVEVNVAASVFARKKRVRQNKSCSQTHNVTKSYTANRLLRSIDYFEDFSFFVSENIVYQLGAFVALKQEAKYDKSEGLLAH